MSKLKNKNYCLYIYRLLIALKRLSPEELCTVIENLEEKAIIALSDVINAVLYSDLGLSRGKREKLKSRVDPHFRDVKFLGNANNHHHWKRKKKIMQKGGIAPIIPFLSLNHFPQAPEPITICFCLSSFFPS